MLGRDLPTTDTTPPHTIQIFAYTCKEMRPQCRNFENQMELNVKFQVLNFSCFFFTKNYSRFRTVCFLLQDAVLFNTKKTSYFNRPVQVFAFPVFSLIVFPRQNLNTICFYRTNRDCSGITNDLFVSLQCVPHVCVYLGSLQ